MYVDAIRLFTCVVCALRIKIVCEVHTYPRFYFFGCQYGTNGREREEGGIERGGV